MRNWLRGKPGGALAFAVITALVAGGLGWATAAALRLEREQLAQRAEAERAAQLRIALWRLDGRLAALLAPESGRPFNHYSAIYVPGHVLAGEGAALVPSPLLDADLPAWMLLHFQVDASTWESPQVLSDALEKQLREKLTPAALANVTPARRQLLRELAAALPAPVLLAHARKHTRPATLRDRIVLLERRQVELANEPSQAAAVKSSQEFLSRTGQLSKLNPPVRAECVARNLAWANTVRNGEELLNLPHAPVVADAEVTVQVSPMVGLWLPRRGGGEQLVVLRLVRSDDREVCQGIALDGPALQRLLVEEVHDLFPDARVLPAHGAVPERLDRALSALPLELCPGPAADEVIGWTPLRVGLATAWAAASVALLAVALGGWSLLNLSERRSRFVWAVTHELRTPLTTLRLYLDMLMNGLVRDEAQRAEYLHTLQAEADRLTRLVNNVLDFARLEGPRAPLTRSAVSGPELLERVRATWQGRCQDAGKELVVETGSAFSLSTDGALLEQVLGTLLDNACKHARDAEDRRVWLRARADGALAVFEVEDRGPGVPARERRSIFRPFRRGAAAGATSGGVGLGLALAKRWAGLLGGRLELWPSPAGACFRVELPLS
jgi:signal transduction histidine kinase